MGNKEQVPAGEFQIRSAGTGIRHSEYNPSSTERLHLYQIWIMPEENGITPRYEPFSYTHLRSISESFNVPIVYATSSK